MAEELGPINVANVLLRQLAWDACNCPEFPDLAERLGLTPTSEDVLEMEHRDSHLRCNRLQPIMLVLAPLVEMLAMVQAARAQEDDTYTDPETDQAILENYRAIVQSTLISGLSMLVSSGAISIGSGVRL